MSISRVKYGQAYVEITGDDNKLTKALKNSINNIRKFGQKARAVGASIAKIGAAVVAVAAVAVTAFAKMGDELDKLSRKTGASVEWLSKMKFAATQSGTSLEGMGKAMKRMAATVFDAGLGLSTVIDALDQMGLKASDLQGLAPEKQFELLADRISKVGDASTRAALAQRIFGRAGVDLLPLIENGAAGLKEFAKEAERLGIVMSTEDAQAAAKLTDEFDRMVHSAKMAVFQVGAALAPAIQEMAATIREMIPKIRDWVKENKGLIVTVAKLGGGLLVAGVALIAFGQAATGVAAAMKLLLLIGPKIAAMFTLLMAHPVIAAVAAVAALGIAIGFLIKSMREQRFEAKEAIKVWGDYLDVMKQVEKESKASADAAVAAVAARVATLKTLEQQLADIMKTIATEQLSDEDKKIQKAKELEAARLKVVQAIIDEGKAIKIATIQSEFQTRQFARDLKARQAAEVQANIAKETGGASPERRAELFRLSEETFTTQLNLGHETLQDRNDTRRAIGRVQGGGTSALEAKRAAIRADSARKIAAIQLAAAIKRSKAAPGFFSGGIFKKARDLLGRTGGAISDVTDKAIGGLSSTTAAKEIGGVISTLLTGPRGLQDSVASAGRGGFIASTLRQGGEDLDRKNVDFNKRTAEATERLADEGLGLMVI